MHGSEKQVLVLAHASPSTAVNCRIFTRVSLDRSTVYISGEQDQGTVPLSSAYRCLTDVPRSIQRPLAARTTVVNPWDATESCLRSWHQLQSAPLCIEQATPLIPGATGGCWTTVLEKSTSYHQDRSMWFFLVCVRNDDLEQQFWLLSSGDVHYQRRLFPAFSEWCCCCLSEFCYHGYGLPEFCYSPARVWQVVSMS